MTVLKNAVAADPDAVQYVKNSFAVVGLNASDYSAQTIGTIVAQVYDIDPGAAAVILPPSYSAPVKPGQKGIGNFFTGIGDALLNVVQGAGGIVGGIGSNAQANAANSAAIAAYNQQMAANAAASQATQNLAAANSKWKMWLWIGGGILLAILLVVILYFAFRKKPVSVPAPAPEG